MPITGQIHIAFGILLLGWFGFYLFRLTHGAVEGPELIGTSAALGSLPKSCRKVVLPALFLAAAAIILICAEPFANSLVQAGTEFGVDQFLLVQWLAPLPSEALAWCCRPAAGRRLVDPGRVRAGVGEASVGGLARLCTT